MDERPLVNPFVGEGSWLRCALHTHTTNSDGQMPPEQLVAHYAWADFDVLAITDHWVRTDPPSTDGLVVIPSVELNASVDGAAADAHVLTLGVTAGSLNWGLDPGSPAPAIQYGGNVVTVKNLNLVSGTQRIAADGTFGAAGEST